MDEKFTIILLLLTYFCLAGIATWILLFETPRKQTISFMQRVCYRIEASLNNMRELSGQTGRSLSQSSINFCKAAGAWLHEQRYVTIITAVLIITPVLLAISLSNLHTLDGFEESTIETDHVVSWLLRGERLVSPPALPPEIFATKEVRLLQPTLGSANRDWSLLEEDFRQRLLQVFKSMANDHGYQAVLLEGYRSPQRQTMLANSGPHVTNAGAFQSYHQFGLAADIAFLRDGRLIISESNPWAMKGYQLLGEAAEGQGLVWGGRWKMRDFGHVELRKERKFAH